MSPGEHISPIEAELAALQERLEEAERFLVNILSHYQRAPSASECLSLFWISPKQQDDIREFLNQRDTQ